MSDIPAIDANIEVSDSQLSKSYGDFESAFRRDHPLTWWATLMGPFLITAIIVFVIFSVAGQAFTMKLLMWGAAALFFLGRFVILAGLDDQASAMTQGATSLQLFWMVSYLDLMLGIVLAFHIGYLFRIPIIGPRVSAFSSDARFILNTQPWMKRATFFGLICFVGFPLSATGAVGGSILGRLLGLNRIHTFVGILIGATMGNLLMYLGSDLVNQYIDKNNPAVKYGGIIIIVAAVFLLNSWYQRIKARFLENDLQKQRAGVGSSQPSS